MDRSSRGLISGTTHEFTWKNWGKPRESSYKIAGLRAEARTRDFQDMKQEC